MEEIFMLLVILALIALAGSAAICAFTGAFAAATGVLWLLLWAMKGPGAGGASAQRRR